MNLFAKYYTKIMLSGDETPLSSKAYLLDGKHPDEPDFRRDAAVGTCNCCDYFFFSVDNHLVLVEDTQLNAYIKDREQEFSYLQDDNVRDTHIWRLICDENVLKVYGSLFVIYRFLARCSSAVNKPEVDLVKFWLIVNDVEKSNVKVLDKAKSILVRNLLSKLGRASVSEVEVMLKSSFIQKMTKEFP